MQKTNKQDAPVGVLVFEAIIFSLAICVFLLFSQVANTFWLLLDLASQVTLIYYTILFISAIRLRNTSKEKNGFQVPGGKIVFAGLMMLGSITSIGCLAVGFIPPSGLSFHEINLFHTIMYSGLIVALALPFIFLRLKTGAKPV